MVPQFLALIWLETFNTSNKCLNKPINRHQKAHCLLTTFPILKRIFSRCERAREHQTFCLFICFLGYCRALAIYHCSPFPFLCFILKNAWGATLIDFFRKTQIISTAEVVQFMGGTYMPVTVSYRTLTQYSSNVKIGWDWAWSFKMLVCPLPPNIGQKYPPKSA